ASHHRRRRSRIARHWSILGALSDGQGTLRLVRAGHRLPERLNSAHALEGDWDGFQMHGGEDGLTLSHAILTLRGVRHGQQPQAAAKGDAAVVERRSGGCRTRVHDKLWLVPATCRS